MRALMVVDIDHHDGWYPEIIKKSENKKHILANIRRVIGFTRTRGFPRIFIILVPDAKGEIGQEAQFSAREVSGQCASERIKKLDFADRVKASSCIVCDIGDEYRLSEELMHQHNGSFEPAFIKNTGDAFSNRRLPKYLKEQGVKEIALAGCNTDACVFYTAQGAVLSGFSIVLLEDCAWPPFSSQGEKEHWIKNVESEIPRNSGLHHDVSVHIMHSQMVYPECLMLPFFV